MSIANLRFAIRVSGSLLCFLAVLCQGCLGADVVYIDTLDHSYIEEQVQSAAKLYGLDVTTAILTGRGDGPMATDAIRRENSLAVVITAGALPNLNPKEVMAALRRPGKPIPLLIAGITGKTDATLLQRWSGGGVTSGRDLSGARGRARISVAGGNEITRQLGGNTLPVNQDNISSFTTARQPGTQWLITVTVDGVQRPTFAEVLINDQEVLFAAAAAPLNIPVTPDPFREQAVFASLAPEIMFLRHAAGERGWHSPGKYANMTIDDLWLREPYGYVNYQELLSEMERHNFHTTIAFIPWNFDRSEPAAVSLFQKHADRFSISVHGNNHDHQEFGPYQEHAFEGQVANIKQGLARMEKFSQFTHIPYDAVMIFPHSVAPERTFGALKAYNYLATANSLNVPSDGVTPADPEFVLRTATLAFANFPSLRRYSAEVEIPQAQLAIDAFLDNPMLFYTHQAFFAPGSGAFNDLADRVNRLQPDTQWRSLGFIAKHLYLEKLRPDGNYDVRAYTAKIHIENHHGRDTVFFIDKEEDFALPVSTFVDGQPYAYERSGTHLRLQLPVHDGASREIEIRYNNDLNLSMTDISKTSFRVNAIRHLSDFRDDVVSKTASGRWFIQSYRGSESSWNGAAVTVSCFCAIAGLCLWLRKKVGVKSPDST